MTADDGRSTNMDQENDLRVLAEGKFVRLVARGRWEWVERTNTSGAVVIVAVTSDRQLVLVEEFRAPVNSRVVELPAGLVGDEPGMGEEKMIEAAKRELLEETGCTADDWRLVAQGPASPGLTNEQYTMYLALDAKQISAGGGDPTEDIRVHLVPLGEVETWLEAKRREGLLVDPKIYAGLYFAESKRRQEPF